MHLRFFQRKIFDDGVAGVRVLVVAKETECQINDGAHQHAADDQTRHMAWIFHRVLQR